VDYLTLKALHVGSVAATYSLFVLRGVWMIAQSPLLARTWVRVVPHVIDSILLASAIALAVLLRQNPLVAHWLAAKIVGLVIYIGFGTIALKRARSKRIRIAAWIAAQAVFGYIVAVALTRSPLPWA
jgi:uncharacterized membrane protein SirB2